MRMHNLCLCSCASYRTHLFVRIVDVKPLLNKLGLGADTGGAY